MTEVNNELPYRALSRDGDRYKGALRYWMDGIAAMSGPGIVYRDRLRLFYFKLIQLTDDDFPPEMRVRVFKIRSWVESRLGKGNAHRNGKDLSWEIVEFGKDLAIYLIHYETK